MADIKCSNCGERLSNVTIAWSKRQWIPAMFFGLIPLTFLFFGPGRSVFFGKPDFTKQLEVHLDKVKTQDGDVEVLDRVVNTGNKIEILGHVTNTGKDTWVSVNVEAEFYAKDGTFLDEARDYSTLRITPQESEHFIINVSTFEKSLLNELEAKRIDVKLKITNATLDRY